MSSIKKQPNGRYWARYRDANGRSRSQTFDLKYDAERFLVRRRVHVRHSLTPVHAFDGNPYELVEGPPKSRRRPRAGHNRTQKSGQTWVKRGQGRSTENRRLPAAQRRDQRRR
jgi:hypothetical protein